MLKKRDNPIASFVRDERKSLKMNQVDMAKKAKVSLKFIRQLEQGKTTVRLDKVNKVLAFWKKECIPGK